MFRVLLGVLIVISGCSATSLEKELNWHRQQRDLLIDDRNELEHRLNIAKGEQEALKKRLVEFTAEIAALRDLRRLPASITPSVGIEEGMTTAVDPASKSGAGIVLPEDLQGIEGVTVQQTGVDEMRLVVNRVLFSAGSSTLTEAGQATLDRISELLKSDYPGHFIRVEGHTDSSPVVKVKARYPSNWELSTARAAAVLRALLKREAAAASRCSISGYGSERPVADNATEEGRKANRRVEVVIRTSRD